MGCFQNYISSVILVIAVGLFVYVMFFHQGDVINLAERNVNNDMKLEVRAIPPNGDVHQTIALLIQQRNNISRALNLKRQKIGQMECEVSRPKSVSLSRK
jgi:hypothetical protein